MIYDAVALATDINYEEELIRAQSGLSDIPVTQVMLDSCQASITDSKGNVIQTDEIYVTVKELGSVSRTENGGTVYSMTVFSGASKTDSGGESLYETYAYGSVVWIDNFGPSNQLVSVSGGWTTSGSETLSDRVVGYGVSMGGEDTYVTEKPTINAFSYNANSNMVSLFLCLETTIKVNGDTLRLRVVNSWLT